MKRLGLLIIVISLCPFFVPASDGIKPEHEGAAGSRNRAKGLNFTKAPGNRAVIRTGGYGLPTTAWDPYIHVDEEGYHIFFTSIFCKDGDDYNFSHYSGNQDTSNFADSFGSIAYGFSKDKGYSWEFRKRPVIYGGGKTGWDDHSIETAHVTRIGKKLHLFYSGTSMAMKSRFQIGKGELEIDDNSIYKTLMKSGKTFSRPKKPFLARQDKVSSFTNNTQEPSVVIRDDRIELYWIGISWKLPDKPGGAPGQKITGVGLMRTVYDLKFKLLEQSKKPIRRDVNITEVKYFDNYYYMFFGTWSEGAFHKNERVGIMSSPDGLNWGDRRVILESGPIDSYDGWGMFGPTVALDGKDLVLFVTTLSMEKGRANSHKLKPGERVGIGMDNKTVYGGIGRATARFSKGSSDGTAWLKDLMEESVGERVKINDVTVARKHIFSPSAYKVSFSFKYRLPKGGIDTGEGSLYIPLKFKDNRNMKFPLLHWAGYSKEEKKNLKLAQNGIVVSNPEKIKVNPLALGPNKDIARLHIVRSLPFIDDSKVGIEGGSAGGYISLLLAAESFPLSYANTSGAVLNRGYNLAYFKKSVELAQKTSPEDPGKVMPVIYVTSHIVEQAFKLFSNDLSDICWYNSSPISQIDTITCPVSLFVSSADTLVPVDQVSADFIVPFDKKDFPEGFTSDLEVLSGNEKERTRLLDILKPGQFEVLKVVPPEGLPIFKQMEYDLAKNPPTTFFKMPFSKTKQWSIVVRDEGAKMAKIGHIKYLAVYFDTDFIDYYRAAEIKPEQLTMRKLERLMSRYAGKKWLEDRFVSLDFPDAEKKDVLRGLVTFSKNSECAARFLALYKKLPSDKQVLDKNILTAGSESVHGFLQKTHDKRLD